MDKYIILRPNVPPEFVGEWNLFETQQAAQIFSSQVDIQVRSFLEGVKVGVKPPTMAELKAEDEPARDILPTRI